MYKHPDLLDEHLNYHEYNTRNRDRYIPPFARLRSSELSVRYNAVKIWNEVPVHIMDCRTLGNFKLRYKEYLLMSYIVR